MERFVLEGRRSAHEAKLRCRLQRFILLATICVPVLVVAFVVLQPRVDPVFLLRDPMASASILAQTSGDPLIRCCPPYLGAISNLGVMIWSGTAGLLLISGLALATRTSSGETSRMLLFGGVLTTVLALDDMFMIHEHVHWMGYGEKLFFLLYGGMLAFYLAAWRGRIADGSWFLLVAALACFALSMTIDLVATDQVAVTLIEDGAKFAGICAWAGHHAALAFNALSGSAARA